MGKVNNPKALKPGKAGAVFAPEQQAVRDHCRQISREIVSEGCVLLKNEGALPLKTTRVNVFGTHAANPFFGGRGSSVADNSDATGLFTALKENGFFYNEELYSLYKNYSKKKRASLKPYPEEKDDQKQQNMTVAQVVLDVFSPPYRKELPAKYLTEDLLSRAAAYSDTAIYVLGRSGSEQHDMKPEELGLLREERETLKRLCARFKTVIVLLNVADTVECGFAEEYPQVKALLFIGFPACRGMDSVAKILRGTLNPSGRTADTWYYHMEDHPAAKNTGTFRYKDAKRRAFLLYKEDIYVGYRYAETFLTEEKYRATVQFPFGYGLSYTTFSWEDCVLRQQDDALQISVTVTNTGALPGKNVVELYVRTPYTGRVEKPVKVLVAYAKTELLAPGKRETLQLQVPCYNFASWTPAGYLLEAGDYVLEFAENAHTVRHTCTFTLEEKRFAGTKRRFEGYEGEFRRLSRRDEDASVLTPPEEKEYLAPDCVKNYLRDTVPVRGGEQPAVGVNRGLRFRDVCGKPYSDELWQKFTEQFTVDELIHLICFGGYQTTPNERFGLPETIQSDGPAGIHDCIDGTTGISYPSGVLLACGWNSSLAEQFGAAVGSEAAYMHVQGWYGPAINIHRHPFGGRNFEYYSEDPLLAGKTGAAVVRGAQEKGLVCFVKHFALNNEDANRQHVHTWASEQSIREIYCKAFELTVREGDAHGIMSALNDIGGKWTGECESLMTGLLREEWDFTGCVVTDFAGAKYMRSDFGVLAGNDLWLAPMNNEGHVKSLKEFVKKDPAGAIRAMQRAAKHILFAAAQSNITEALS